MSRVRLTLIALGMAIAVPAPTGAGLSSPTSVSEPAACTPQPDSADSDARWVWRLRAYRHLDCVDAIVERALSAPSRDRIELSRGDLERIRVEASQARAAAARMD